MEQILFILFICQCKQHYYFQRWEKEDTSLCICIKTKKDFRKFLVIHFMVYHPNLSIKKLKYI